MMNFNFKDNEKLKEFFEENKKKILALGLVVGGFIVYSFVSSSDNNQSSDDKKMDFNIGKNKTYQEDSIVYNPDMNPNENPKMNYSQSQNDNIDDLNQSLNELEGMEITNNTPVTPYNPYGDRDMYEIPRERAKPRKIQSSQGYDYEAVYNEPQPQQVNNSSNSKPVQQKNSNVWTNPKYKNDGGQNPNSKSNVVYKASIVSTRQKYLTPENNRVQIRVIEPFVVNGVTVPRTTQLIAYASFQNELKLEIKSIIMNGKQIPVNISVLDSQGQEAIEIIGGTGAEIQDELEKEAVNSNRTGNNVVDKAVNVFTGKKKVKAIVSNDYVYLRIN